MYRGLSEEQKRIISRKPTLLKSAAKLFRNANDASVDEEQIEQLEIEIQHSNFIRSIQDSAERKFLSKAIYTNRRLLAQAVLSNVLKIDFKLPIFGLVSMDVMNILEQRPEIPFRPLPFIVPPKALLDATPKDLVYSPSDYRQITISAESDIQRNDKIELSYYSMRVPENVWNEIISHPSESDGKYVAELQFTNDETKFYALVVQASASGNYELTHDIGRRATFRVFSTNSIIASVEIDGNLKDYYDALQEEAATIPVFYVGQRFFDGRLQIKRIVDTTGRDVAFAVAPVLSDDISIIGSRLSVKTNLCMACMTERATHYEERAQHRKFCSGICQKIYYWR